MLINKPKATVWLHFTQCAGTNSNNEPLTNANKMYYIIFTLLKFYLGQIKKLSYKNYVILNDYNMLNTVIRTVIK